MTARAPVLRGNVGAFRASAAAGECLRIGRPEVGWLNRDGLLPRVGPVYQPYLTPRFAVWGRSASGRINDGESCAQLVGNLGAIVRGRVVVAGGF